MQLKKGKRFDELPEGRIRRRRGKFRVATLPVEELIRQRGARSGNGAPIADPTHAKASRNYDLAVRI